MVAKGLLVKILLRVILPLAVILVIVFGLSYFGLESAEEIGLKVWAEEDVEQVIAGFMENGAARNIEGAHAYCSNRVVSEVAIAEFIESGYDEIFAGYKGLNIEEAGRDLSEPIYTHSIAVEQGNLKAKGIIIYDDGKVLKFTAFLTDENDVVEITDIRIGYHRSLRGY